MASTSTPRRAGQVSPDAGKHGTQQKHVHHGKTPAAWVGSGLALLAFIVGGIAMVIEPLGVLFWISVAIAAAAIIATKVLQRMGHGAD